VVQSRSCTRSVEAFLKELLLHRLPPRFKKKGRMLEVDYAIVVFFKKNASTLDSESSRRRRGFKKRLLLHTTRIRSFCLDLGGMQ